MTSPSAAELLAVASHELRSPLTALVGYASTLRDRRTELSDDELAQCTAAIERQAQRVARLVDDLLVASTVEAGGRPPARESVDVAAVIRDALDDVPPTRHEVYVHIADGLSPAAADAGHLQRVVVNLLSNAMRYSRAGSRIDVSAEPDGDGVRVEVADRGRGIDPAQVQRLFGRFERGLRPDRAGCGIGLYVVRQLTEAMDGRITVDTTPGGGSTFAVTLPRFVARPGSVPAPAAAVAPTAA
jgi:two-component system sensor histidine kinase KdpD